MMINANTNTNLHAISNSNSKRSSLLRIRGIELLVHLGWEEAEREQAQLVRFDIEIQFTQIPVACTSDELTDTICYAELITDLRHQFSKQSFRLIEHLAAAIYDAVKLHMHNNHANITIQLTKHPHIEGLNGDVSFSVSDQP